MFAEQGNFLQRLLPGCCEGEASGQEVMRSEKRDSIVMIWQNLFPMLLPRGCPTLSYLMLGFCQTWLFSFPLSLSYSLIITVITLLFHHRQYLKMAQSNHQRFNDSKQQYDHGSFERVTT